MKSLFKLIFLLTFMIQACQPKVGEEVMRINRGKAQGTTYNIQYITIQGTDYQREIDSIFAFVDQEMSTYVPSSTISRLNAGEVTPIETHFYNVLKLSDKIYQMTDGLFDITVYPLVQLWKIEDPNFTGAIDSSKVDSVLNFIGFSKIAYDSTSVKLPAGMKLDLNAIAQGYTVDVIAEFLESKGIQNYMVEVGGEVRCKGKNINNKIWLIGIEKPVDDPNNQKFQTVIKLKDKSLATSGSYRKYRTLPNGSRLSHTINPKTGYPTNHNLLSVSVMADDCATADGLATALLVMGLQEAKQFASKHPEFEYLFIYFDRYKGYETWRSEGFSKYVER
ncbi:FAD:protein FMN transferase [Thermaurantimonas aggregans]|uniref:FAD:protein FMN transferase n=1 Tax=Thermaurantimonas aggregans TaxID=2173829 RepID=A0A401XNZ0_9FLAO|nr:FAD:protein FMN transferase [Thermaurantimonas aggregans]GCD78729.1 FAD:protein FMN transferase [Thermaurantimonas aggregans]